MKYPVIYAVKALEDVKRSLENLRNWFGSSDAGNITDAVSKKHDRKHRFGSAEDHYSFGANAANHVIIANSEGYPEDSGVSIGDVATSGEIPGSVSSQVIKARAYLNVAQEILSNAVTLVGLDTSSFDPSSIFNATSHVFTPTSAGYYLAVGATEFSSAMNNHSIFYILVNNNSVARTREVFGNNQGGIISDLVYCDGVDDTIGLGVYQCTGDNKRALVNDNTRTFLSVVGPF